MTGNTWLKHEAIEYCNHMIRAFTLIVLTATGVCCSQDKYCVEKGFKHKAPEETAALKVSERLDQMVLEQLFHMPSIGDEYYDLLHDSLVKDGLAVLPRATQFMEEYEPNAPKCTDLFEVRLLVAAQYISYADKSAARLRGSETGRSAISSLEKAISKRNKTGSEGYENDNRNRLLAHYLETLRGLNAKDGIISIALRKRYNIQISREELLKFSEHLISVDPTYPSWSTVITSDKEMSDAEAERFYQAYNAFRKRK